MSLGQELAPHLPFLRRYARAFRLIDPTLLRIYQEASELADVRLEQ